MALTGIEIFKHLPKTNCKECGFPTCLAFAMKLAAKQVSIDACPHVSDAAKALLGEASAPPIRLISIFSSFFAITGGAGTGPGLLKNINPNIAPKAARIIAELIIIALLTGFFFDDDCNC